MQEAKFVMFISSTNPVLFVLLFYQIETAKFSIIKMELLLLEI